MRTPEFERKYRNLSSLKQPSRREITRCSSKGEQAVDEAVFFDALTKTNDDPIPAPLALDIRFPACGLLADSSEFPPTYVNSLIAQFRRYADFLDSDRQIVRMSISGESASVLSSEHWLRLGKELAEKFLPDSNDSRVVTWHAGPSLVNNRFLQTLYESGIRRLCISLRIGSRQGFGEWIRQLEHARELTHYARNAGITVLRLTLSVAASQNEKNNSIGRSIEVSRPNSILPESGPGVGCFEECGGDFDILGLGPGSPCRLGSQVFTDSLTLSQYLRHYRGALLSTQR